ncbi:Nuclear Hormone Receptor family [Caenorhabditis elegans]|uniref:Nuclear Hormone Receptor family n=2 Tax=Caenorhabditis elegans TaxID=6239 RepID=Q7YXC6_CAEEL|nr:Nuclear Hormone Receptor family [Caenorhabditis elegans]CAD91709.1 Nuclear Hormone Receptor family [Caenorhabditis elegans]|eukprot:NP_001024230.1 Nuclear Hormone Receptor family [Caenorhabditis elegans]
MKIAKISHILPQKCEICKIQKCHGNHFGVNSCRACAAFFRRTVNSKWSRMRCLGGSCNQISFLCKPCRLQQCFNGGMMTNNFQYNRDVICPMDPQPTVSIPKSLEIYLGKPYFVMLSEKNSEKTEIDLHRLLGEASKILSQGSASPSFCAGNQLKKLSLGLPNQIIAPRFKMAEKVAKAELVANWEYYVKKVAAWLAHFDDFRRLDVDLQMKLLQSIWHIWSRLEKLSATAKYRKTAQSYKKTDVVLQGDIVVDVEHVYMDTRWLSNFPLEQFRRFMIHSSCDQYDVTQALYDLSPTDIELTYMLAQLCFQYAGNRYQGRILEVCDRFLTVLSNDLHDYYIKDLGMLRYAGRLAKMMQVNNSIQENIRKGRERMQLIRCFGVLKLEFSHPEMFLDSGFH